MMLGSDSGISGNGNRGHGIEVDGSVVVLVVVVDVEVLVVGSGSIPLAGKRSMAATTEMATSASMTRFRGLPPGKGPED